MAYSHCTGTDRDRYRKQHEAMCANMWYRNVHRVRNTERKWDPFCPIVLIQFPVPVPFQCSVNELLGPKVQEPSHWSEQTGTSSHCLLLYCFSSLYLSRSLFVLHEYMALDLDLLVSLCTSKQTWCNSLKFTLH